jgi:hypothetical protein
MPCIGLESGSCKRQTSYCLALLSGMPQRRARAIDATQVDFLLIINRVVFLLDSHGSIATLLPMSVVLCCVQLTLLMDLNASHLAQWPDCTCASLHRRQLAVCHVSAAVIQQPPSSTSVLPQGIYSASALLTREGKHLQCCCQGIHSPRAEDAVGI